MIYSFEMFGKHDKQKKDNGNFKMKKIHKKYPNNKPMSILKCVK